MCLLSDSVSFAQWISFFPYHFNELNSTRKLHKCWNMIKAYQHDIMMKMNNFNQKNALPTLIKCDNIYYYLYIYSIIWSRWLNVTISISPLPCFQNQNIDLEQYFLSPLYPNISPDSALYVYTFPPCVLSKHDRIMIKLWIVMKIKMMMYWIQFQIDGLNCFPCIFFSSSFFSCFLMFIVIIIHLQKEP